MGASWASFGSDEINEYAFVVVPQVGQVVREVGKVVAGANLQVLADVTIYCSQHASAALTHISKAKHSRFSDAFPALTEPPVGTQHRELCSAVEELPLLSINAYLSHAVGVLAAD